MPENPQGLSDLMVIDGDDFAVGPVLLDTQEKPVLNLLFQGFRGPGPLRVQMA